MLNLDRAARRERDRRRAAAANGRVAAQRAITAAPRR
jgi:hypothetical protein